MGLEDTKVQFAHWRAGALKQVKIWSIHYLEQWSVVDVKGKSVRQLPVR